MSEFPLRDFSKHLTVRKEIISGPLRHLHKLRIFFWSIFTTAEEMKPSNHPFHERSKLGLYFETILKPRLENIVGEALTKTSESCDEMDFESENYYVELKTRSDSYHPSQWFIKRDGWILPYCKILRARQEIAKGKRVIFFYFWIAGKTLYRWDFTEEGVGDAKLEYPEWHLDQQQQIYIKEHHWIQIS